MVAITPRGELLTFAVRVQPRASRSGVRGEVDGALRVALAALPVDGAANDELIRFLARLLGVAPRRITILQGLHSRSKTVAVEGLSLEVLSGLLAKATNDQQPAALDR